MPAAHATSPSPQISLSIKREQARAIFGNQLLSLPINSLLAISVALVFVDKVSPITIGIWLAAVLTVNVGRYMVGRHYWRGESERSDPSLFLWLCTLGYFVSALVWIVALGGDFDVLSSRATILIVVYTGICAGAVIQNAAYAPPALVFIVPMLVILIIRLTYGLSSLSIALLLDVFYFLVFLVRSSFVLQAAFRESSFRKHQAADLAASLQREHEISIDANIRLSRLANLDSLTGLLNRAAFSASIETWCQRARDEAGQFVLLLADLDNFKSINDTLGHRAGDDVLKTVADRLTATTAVDHVVARLGGDEFAILMRCTVGVDDCVVADAMIERVSGALTVLGRRVTIGMSIGVATYPIDSVDPDDLLAAADLALYAAKDNGRGHARRFDRRLRAAAEIARDLENDLPHALTDGSLAVWYQPQIQLDGQRLVGLEALLRWRHPRYGWVEPPMIVAAALRTRTSEALTGFVLADAASQIRSLTQAGYGDVTVAVNISPSELDHYVLPDLLEQTIGRDLLGARRFELEITEEALVTSADTIAMLNGLSRLGVRLAIDDFGTGCSSIAYFRSLKVDRIKIDKCFVTGLADREGDRDLVRTIVGIGQSLNVEVIAEGVETAEDCRFLRSLGCDLAQGYHFGRPMSAEALTNWLQAFADEPRIPTIPWNALAKTG